MRISGWSSDVCSSDLGRKPKVSVADNLSCPAAGGSVPPSRPALTAQAFRDVEADGVDEAGLDLRRDRLPEIGKLAGQLALDLGPGRSEEHTSELQSLMRISYAVFCLKKKNKHHCKRSNQQQRHNAT